MQNHISYLSLNDTVSTQKTAKKPKPRANTLPIAYAAESIDEIQIEPKRIVPEMSLHPTPTQNHSLPNDQQLPASSLERSTKKQ
jgi:hypothetical protein